MNAFTQFVRDNWHAIQRGDQQAVATLHELKRERDMAVPCKCGCGRIPPRKHSNVKAKRFYDMACFVRHRFYRRSLAMSAGLLICLSVHAQVLNPKLLEPTTPKQLRGAATPMAKAATATPLLIVVSPPPTIYYDLGITNMFPTATTNKVITLQRSNDLHVWTSIETNTTMAVGESFTDRFNAAPGQTFYRVMYQ
jgi:hypothetical protein